MRKRRPGARRATRAAGQAQRERLVAGGRAAQSTLGSRHTPAL
jgi:hypothetical protein